eukprot:scaffold1573_cov125-Isochrysis_galbana.AAC.3
MWALRNFDLGLRPAGGGKVQGGQRALPQVRHPHRSPPLRAGRARAHRPAGDPSGHAPRPLLCV